MTATVKVLSLLAIAIPAILAASSVSLLTTAPIKINCSDPAIHEKINKSTQDFHTCFKSLVLTELAININETIGSCTSIDMFNNTAIKNYLNVTSQCKTETENRHQILSDNLHKFVDIVNSTLAGGHYKNFCEHGGVQCVTKKRDHIQNCIQNRTLRNVTVEPQLALSGFAVLDCVQGCSDIIDVKDCIGGEFQKSPKICTEHSITYTKKLFDKVYDEFCKNCTDSKPSSSSQVVGVPISIAIMVYFVVLQSQ